MEHNKKPLPAKGQANSLNTNMDPLSIPDQGNKSSRVTDPQHSAEQQGNILPKSPPGKKRKFAQNDTRSESLDSFGSFDNTVHIVDNSDLRESIARSRQKNSRFGAKPQSTPLIFEGSSKTVHTWARYLVVESENPEEPLAGLSPWAIEEGFKGISQAIKIERNLNKDKGIFLIECQNERASKNALARNGTNFVDRKIKVSPHRSLNTSRGVIHCYDLRNDTIEFIEEKLKSQGVTKVHRARKGKSEPPQFTHTYFLTFGTPTPPENVKIAYIKVKVEPFIEKPHQCHNCKKFGHSKHKCRGKPVCGQCGSEAHEGSCPHAPKCSNCGGTHGPTSKKCGIYLKEVEILKIKSERKVSFKEAKRIVDTSSSITSPNLTFAAVTGKKLPQGEKFFKSRQVQWGVEIPEAVLAESRHLARELLQSLKDKRKQTDAFVQFSGSASKSPGVQQTPKTKKKSKKSAKKQVSKPASTTSQFKPGESSSHNNSSLGKPASDPKAAEIDALQNTEAEMEDDSTSAPALQAAEGDESSITFGFSSPIKTTKEKAGEKVVRIPGELRNSPGSSPAGQQKKVESHKAVLAAAKLNFSSDKYKSGSRVIRGANTVSSASQGSSSPGKDKLTNKLVPSRPQSPPKQSSFISSNRFSSLQEEESDKGDHTEDDDSNDEMEYVSS